jgi:hypothetical protein
MASVESMLREANALSDDAATPVVVDYESAESRIAQRRSVASGDMRKRREGSGGERF